MLAIQMKAKFAFRFFVEVDLPPEMKTHVTRKTVDFQLVSVPVFGSLQFYSLAKQISVSSLPCHDFNAL
jgi:hypothetical protein